MSKILARLQKIIWAIFLVTLPVTSFPHFPSFMGKNALVRPLSLYPLFLLIILMTLPRLFARPVPKTVIPFFVFLFIAVASTIFSFSRGIEPNLGTTVEGRALRTLITLGIGVVFYLTVTLMPEDSGDLRFSLKWLYLGFVIALIWASLQIVYVLEFDRAYFDLLNDLQHLISSRRLFNKRISGPTYEPSWFAEQITFVLMPFLFASAVSRFSVFRWRWRGLTVEMLLLGWSAIALLFTFSRGGLALFFILLVIALFLRFRQTDSAQQFHWSLFLKRFAQIGLILLVLGVIIFAVGQRNGYFSRLWGYWTDEEAEGTFLYYIAFDQRFTYWGTALRIFDDYPVFGVGLGNYTFYFDEYLPDRQYRTPEIFLKLVPDVGRNQIVTVKNLLIRVLAETGIVGFAVFVAFLIALLGCAIHLLGHQDAEIRFWGRAGLLGLIAFFVVTLSVDSFAIPNMWVVFGLITASAHIFSRSECSCHLVEG